jgi:hypothetical protein
MAKKKKSQVPAPPRTVQAPKVRTGGPTGPRKARDPRRTRIIVLSVIGAVVAVGAIVGVVIAAGGGGASGSDRVAVGGACAVKTYPSQGRQHVTKLPKGFKYNSYPPTSGPHYPPGDTAPAVWNFYDQPIREIVLVHNLEHGGVIVQYGPKVPQSTVQKIAKWYQKDPRGLVVAPFPTNAPASVANKVTLSAWTHLATCTGFDEGAFDAFVQDYRAPNGDNPEKFPLDALQPGGQ